MSGTLRGQNTCQLCFKCLQLTGELNIEFSRVHYLQKSLKHQSSLTKILIAEKESQLATKYQLSLNYLSQFDTKFSEDGYGNVLKQ